MRGEKVYKVGVFSDPDGKRPRAYTMWYDPQWSGCCEHSVAALSGAEAKRFAIRDHMATCQSAAPAAQRQREA